MIQDAKIGTPARFQGFELENWTWKLRGNKMGDWQTLAL